MSLVEASYITCRAVATCIRRSTRRLLMRPKASSLAEIKMKVHRSDVYEQLNEIFVYRTPRPSLACPRACATDGTGWYSAISRLYTSGTASEYAHTLHVYFNIRDTTMRTYVHAPRTIDYFPKVFHYNNIFPCECLLPRFACSIYFTWLSFHIETK